MSNGKFRLLEAFCLTFLGQVYKHRNSTQGNRIGRELFEDIFKHEVSSRYNTHVKKGRGVVNIGGTIHTPREIRRNDSVFGCPPAGAEIRPVRDGYMVPEGPVAEPRIGCEVKIIAKSHQKQIDRVVNDLEGFLLRMKVVNRKCINVAVIGINFESNYIGWERERSFKHRLRAQEPEAVLNKLRILNERYDEVLILRFRATNQPPYPFEWLDPKRVDLDYGAVVTRVGELYQARFR